MKLLLVLALIGCGNTAKKTPDAAVDAPPPTLDCTYYCATMQANCAGPFLQYTNAAMCMASCGKFQLGKLDQMTGNTLGCRINHAGLAAASPMIHCTHAGPGGDGQCGTNCEGFCTLATTACPGVYPSVPGCMTTCAGFATMPPYTAAVQMGNSLSCRLYHATAAADDPATHCGHIAAVSSACQ
jgi:hypothetical protein